MRHSIIFKFIAVFLCAVCLLSAAGSALGIFVMSQMGLYGKTPEEAYTEATNNTVNSLAAELAVRYASRELGGADEWLVDSYYGTHWMQSAFNWDQVAYTISDAEGNVLDQQEMISEQDILSPYTFQITDASYLNVLNTMSQEEYEELRYPVTEPVSATIEPDSGLTVYNAVPAEGCDITYLHVTFRDGHGEDYDLGGEVLGTLGYYTSNQLIFRFLNQDLLQPLIHSLRSDSPVHMICGTLDGRVMLEISAPDGILDELSNNDDGHSYFLLRPLEDGALLPTGTIYDAIPPEGQAVSWVSVIYADGTQLSTAVNDGTIGYLGYDGDGYVVFTADFAGLLNYRTEEVTYIAFEDRNRCLVYEASDEISVGRFYLENDTLIFRAREPAAEENKPAVSDEGIYIYDDVPPGGYVVYHMELWLEESPRGIVIEDTEPHLGTADHDSSGNVIFTALNWQDFVFSKPANVVYILMESEDGRLLYEAKQEGVPVGSGCIIGTFAYDEGGALVFRRSSEPDAAAETTAAIPTEELPSETVPTVPAAQILDTVNVRFDPHEASEVIGMLEAGTTVPLLQTTTLLGVEWGKTELGWILLDPETVTVTEVPEADMNFALTEETIPDTIGAEEETLPASTEEDTADTTEPTMAQETSETGEPSVPATQETLPTEISETVDVTEPSMASETEMSTEPTYAPDTTDVTEPEAAPGIPPSTDPYEIALAEDSLRVYGYYDPSLGEHRIAEYTYEDIPEYQVEVVLGPGALAYQGEWVLMEQLYSIRQYLIPGLIVSLLLFAVTAVYLCCSAGRRPGTTEVRASGLNCIPLDLYLAGAVGGVMLCALGFVEGGEYLMRQDLQIGLMFCSIMAFAACLLIVAFCFAFAAQVKTPGGYWWRNSICGRSLKIIAWLWHKFVVLCGWLWKILDEKLEPLLVRLCKAAWKLTKFFCIQLKAGFLWLCAKLILGWRWLTRILDRFFSMLPLTWQFLVTGFLLVFLLYIMMRTYKVGYILLGFGIFFGVILYAASAFGILLENAKRMRKGDLDTKVDDKLLIGSFRDFAEELNGLADVAVVAAQKQLKSERMKTELITNVSHDIKTPLTSIINYVDLMEKPHSPEEQQAYLEVLSRQSQRLKKLIDDLMEMSKASTGNMAVDISEVNAVEAVNQALGEFADKLDKAQLIPVFRQPEKEIHMMADGRLVWRVLSNLLSNAVKYAMPGTRLYIDLMELEGKVVLSLKNISRDSLNINADELLERFVRGDTARNTEGSGLGLNIAQSLMELQKGKLEILVDGDLFKVTLIFPGA